MRTRSLYVVTGVSGSGKSTAISAFEDLGFSCVENLPAQMIGDYARYLESGGELHRPEVPGYALLLDCRDIESSKTVIKELKRLQSLGVAVFVLFLDCQDDVILRRYQETRRPHPLILEGSATGTMSNALQLERSQLSSFRAKADRIIDTSSFSPHDLKRAIESMLGSTHAFSIEICSFGFKFGIPRDADIVLDVRFLPNPHFVPELRPLTGNDAQVSEFVFHSGEAEELVKKYSELLIFLLPRYRKEGKHYLSIAFGCTGGRHRSVAIANRIAAELVERGYVVSVGHRDKDRV